MSASALFYRAIIGCGIDLVMVVCGMVLSLDVGFSDEVDVDLEVLNWDVILFICASFVTICIGGAFGLLFPYVFFAISVSLCLVSSIHQRFRRGSVLYIC